MENEVVADGAVKVKKKNQKNFSTMFFFVCVCVGRAPESNDGQGWKQTDKNAPSRHIMWAALADCVAIVLCQLTCVMSGYPVSKPLALPREYTARANSNCT